MSSHYSFVDLIAPYDVEDFFQKHWETQFLYISRNTEDYYYDILNYEDLDIFLQNKRLTIDNDRFVIVKDGEYLSYNQWATYLRSNQYLIDNDKMYVLLNQGATLVINGVDKKIPKLINFCSALERELKFRLRANVYITPPNAQGFAAHYDDHDVFIMQISGTKIWQLYDAPIELPSRQPDQKTGKHVLETPEFEVELNPGDLLYIPRGIIHQAFTTATTSIHITLGLLPTYWFELLREVATLAQESPSFRKAIPHGFTNDDQKRIFKKEFLQLTQTLIGHLNIDELLEKEADQFMIERTSEDQGRFIDLMQIGQINLDSVLSKRKNIVFKVEKDDKNIHIKFYQKTLTFPAFLISSLHTILWEEYFSIRDIGGLINDEGRIELATKFIREGFLKIEKIHTID